MTPDPKPAPRVKVRKPMARKRATPRRKAARCTYVAPGRASGRCKRSQNAGTLCKTHAKMTADALWGKLVRTDECELGEALGTACGGPIQACHGFSRGYLGTRWLLANGFSGCASHNFFAEIHSLEWDDFLHRRWGEKQYNELRFTALSFGINGESVDYPELIAGLKKQLEG